MEFSTDEILHTLALNYDKYINDLYILFEQGTLIFYTVTVKS